MKIISFRDIQMYPRGYFSLSFALTTIEMECNNGKWDESLQKGRCRTIFIRYNDPFRSFFSDNMDIFQKNEGREERKNKREGCVILKEILGRRARISSDKGKGGEGGRESYMQDGRGSVGDSLNALPSRSAVASVFRGL